MIEALETPTFTQQQVLRMIPTLKAKTLKNWVDRGILDEGRQKPTKGYRRLYSPLVVIMLDFMQQVGRYGIPPIVARELANLVAETAVDFWESGPTITRTGDGKSRLIPIYPDKLQELRRAIIVVSEEENDERGYFMYFPDSMESPEYRLTHRLSIVFEIEYHIIMTINSIFWLEGELI